MSAVIVYQITVASINIWLWKQVLACLKKRKQYSHEIDSSTDMYRPSYYIQNVVYFLTFDWIYKIARLQRWCFVYYNISLAGANAEIRGSRKLNNKLITFFISSKKSGNKTE